MVFKEVGIKPLTLNRKRRIHMAEKSVAIKVVGKAEPQAAVKKVVNRKCSGPHSAERHILSDDFFEAYYAGLGRFAMAVWTVFYIIPALVSGTLEGLIQGLLKGLQKATAVYEKQVEKKR